MNLLPKNWPPLNPHKKCFHWYWPDQEWAEQIQKQGFYYGVWVMRKGKPLWFTGSILPGIIPIHKIAQTYAFYVDDVLGICVDCSGAICHVIEEGSGNKFCPVLFHDLVKPKWKVKDLI